MLAAGAIVLAMVESSFPPIFSAVPGVKLGLSNIVVMYVLFFVGGTNAYAVAGIKSLFVLLLRGPVAALLSLTGGMLSVTIIVVLVFLTKKRASHLILSVAGAVTHNLGQLIVVAFLYTKFVFWAYLPTLIVSGILAGIATAVLMKWILPALQKLGFNR